jgi:UDPglucose--hexose-1-phosphate uridylyltransferase
LSHTEAREDPLTGTLVLVAPHRRGLGPPAPAAPGLPAVPPERCPFCPGRESETEATLLQAPAEGPWEVRVVDNRYPLATPETSRSGPTALLGAHELVVETRAHELDLPDFTVAHTATLLGVIAARLDALAARPGIASVVAFRNRGRRAGSSQPHSHSQLLALDRVPNGIALRDARARAHQERTGRALLDDALRDELADGRRIVRDEGRIVTLCPYASQHLHETWLVPRERVTSLGAMTELALLGLASALVDATKRLRAAGAGSDYNLLVHEPPVASRAEAWSGLYLELAPRTTTQAGFELATGATVLTLPPEDAARALRDALP